MKLVGAAPTERKQDIANGAVGAVNRVPRRSSAVSSFERVAKFRSSNESQRVLDDRPHAR